MMFWLTPIVYPITIIPEAYRHWFTLNPMFPIVDAYQQILVFGNSPKWEGVLVVAAIGLLLTLLGLFVFRRAGDEMVDAL